MFTIDSTIATSDRQVALATTYDSYDPELWERMLPLVDYIEVTPDSIARAAGDGAKLNPDVMAQLKDLGAGKKIIVHGIGLSIGSASGWSERYLNLLDDFMAQVDVAWHSEHLGYTLIDGEFMGTMLAMPRTQEALDLLTERVLAIQRRYPCPFLLENIIHVLPDCPGQYTDAGFLNALTRRTGCGLILDVYNLECDAANHGFDIPAFLDELTLPNVREMHVACGVQERGLWLDVHSNVTRECTVTLAREILARPGISPQVLVYELLPQAIPVLGHDAIIDELRRLRCAFDMALVHSSGMRSHQRNGV